ncbi:MAG: glutamine-hydrolyzing carbamoyl-phosphate synthase small subunit [Bacteroidetes bacterium]|nr:glutamine-hydrolyzing carbamoyl-phosphate synthase small subunit [Bacteroidota bacterium]
MKILSKLPALLVLADGTVFKGSAIGKIGTTSGELCFNTGLTGYQEIFTDPSYYKQILISTNVHVGNYGTLNADVESDGIKIAGLVCKSFSDVFSRHDAHVSLQDYFIENNLCGIADIDTRELVRHIRDKGAMNAIISSEILDVPTLQQQLALVPSMAGLELSSQVSTAEAYESGDELAKYRVALLDFGVKNNIVRCLVDRGCHVKIFPARTPVAEMLKFKPHGFMLSNGPGDPSSMDYAIQTVKEILTLDLPVFGICLGHQLLALACDINTYKMHCGHRGLNHPILNLETGLSEITSQNHGFSVVAEEIRKSDKVTVTHVNLNDNTIEGLRVNNKPAFSVQYHPEAFPGPHDSRYLFDNFMALMA